MDTEEYSDYIADPDKAADFMDGYVEVGVHGYCRIGRIVRHGQIWFAKSYVSGDMVEAEMRLRKEYETLLKLNHPGIVRAGWIERLPDVGLCLAMEYIEGETLDRFLPRATLSERREIAGSLLQIMAFVHSRGITHLDLKPQNIMISGHDDSLRVKLIDFGMSQSTGNLLCNYPGGNREYGAPEQFSAEYNAAPTADVYSLGKLLAEINPGRKYHGLIRSATHANPALRPVDATAMLVVLHRSALRRRLTAAVIIAVITILAAIVFLTLRTDKARRAADVAPTAAMDSITAVTPSPADDVRDTDITVNETRIKYPGTPSAGQSAGPANEYERMLSAWSAHLDSCLTDMRTIAQREELPVAERRRIMERMNDSIVEDTRRYFLPLAERLGDSYVRSQPISWGSIYDPAFNSVRQKMTEIYESLGR